MANFTAFQFLAYRVPTFTTLAASSYVPDTTNAVGKGLDTAPRALMQRFSAVLNYAKTLSAVDSKQTTLKVFVAPEFYFKGVGDHWGSFQFNGMINMLEALKAIGAPGPDWVVVAGSLIFYLPKAPGYQHEDGSALKSNECVYANVAPVITQGGLTYVLKHFISDIDYKPKKAADLESLWQAEDFAPCIEEWTERKSHFITVGDRTLGLEICLDHLKGELADTITMYPKRETGHTAPTIDLHVITACGMKIQTPLARKNGYVALVDGIGHGADVGSQLCKVGDRTCTDVIKPSQTFALTGSLTVSSTQKLPSQSIAVYPTQQLP
jgi:hypothetical protein